MLSAIKCIWKFSAPSFPPGDLVAINGCGDDVHVAIVVEVTREGGMGAVELSGEGMPDKFSSPRFPPGDFIAEHRGAETPSRRLD